MSDNAAAAAAAAADDDDDDVNDDDVVSWSWTRRLRSFVGHTSTDKSFSLAGSRQLSTCRSEMKPLISSLLYVRSLDSRSISFTFIINYSLLSPHAVGLTSSQNGT